MKINTIHLKRFTIGLLMLGLVALTGCGSTAGSSPSKAVATSDEIAALKTISGKKTDVSMSILGDKNTSQKYAPQTLTATEFHTKANNVGYSFTYKGTAYTEKSEITLNGKPYTVFYSYFSYDNATRVVILYNNSHYLQEYETADFLVNQEWTPSYEAKTSQNELKVTYNNFNYVVQFKDSTNIPVAKMSVTEGHINYTHVINTQTLSGSFKWPFKIVAKNREFSGTLESDITASEVTCDLYNQAGGLIGKLTLKQDGKISVKTYTDISHSQLEEVLATE